ncbi:MAG TPA: FprA family A-type flavoprotein [Spirochaetia bacterium]|nr:FprA family A-type flavoprotein [Spirochaetia bacterium]
MNSRQIADNIHALSVDDHSTPLFEGLWPVQPGGVTYNSYVIIDEKNVIIDLTREFKAETLLEAVSSIVDLAKIDYLVVNHMEPDHSGALRTLVRIAPNVKIICTPAATAMLESYYSIKTNIHEAADGEKLKIGKKTLVFHHTPLVHWPETMVTFEETTGTLFSCDLFGSYGAATEQVYDDELSNIDEYLKESLRYFSNILAKFSPQVGKAVELARRLAPKVIAPSHGTIWRKDPGRIVELYGKWAGYGSTGGEPGVTLIYASMYGNTAEAMNAVVRGLASASVTANVFNVNETHLSHILPSLWVNRGVVIGSPTYEGNIFPGIRHVLIDAGAKRIFGKSAAFFGSWSWSSGALREITNVVKPFHWEVKEALEFEGAAKEDVMRKAFELGAAFGKRIKAGK